MVDLVSGFASFEPDLLFYSEVVLLFWEFRMFLTAYTGLLGLSVWKENWFSSFWRLAWVPPWVLIFWLFNLISWSVGCKLVYWAPLTPLTFELSLLGPECLWWFWICSMCSLCLSSVWMYSPSGFFLACLSPWVVGCLFPSFFEWKCESPAAVCMRSATADGSLIIKLLMLLLFIILVMVWVFSFGSACVPSLPAWSVLDPSGALFLSLLLSAFFFWSFFC